MRPDQIGTADTIEALCDGVSSRRNQLLVDLGAELSLGAIDGAAEADWNALSATVTKLARTYSPFGPVLTEAVSEQLRKFAGAAGSKSAAIGDRVRDTWQLGPGWVSHVSAELAAGLRDGSSTRGGSLGYDMDLSDLNSVVDHAVQAVGEAQGVSVSMPATGGGEGATVDSAALDELSESITGPDGVLASTARHLLGKLGLADAGVETDSDEDLDAELVKLVESELGSDWARKVSPVLRRPPRGAASTTAGPPSARTSPASGSATTPPASTASSDSTRPHRHRPAGGWTAHVASSAPTWSPSTAARSPRPRVSRSGATTSPS